MTVSLRPMLYFRPDTSVKILADYIPQLKLAYYFASAAHAAVKQLRKYTNEPYFTHPESVANKLIQLVPAGSLEIEMLQAALLHDVEEDTGVDNELVVRMFGQTVGQYVSQLSKVTTPEMGSRQHRHGLEVRRLALCGWQVQTIKTCDLLDNAESIVENDPEFAKVYLPEKADTLDALGEMARAFPDLNRHAWSELAHFRSALERKLLETNRTAS